MCICVCICMYISTHGAGGALARHRVSLCPNVSEDPRDLHHIGSNTGAFEPG